jgi:dephospho-CoA kinase
MNPRGPLVIGITGTIAAGKSTVSKMLVARGAVHADADQLAHTLYDPGTPGFERVVAEFGEDIVGSDGHVDRKILGARVFGNRDALTRLSRAMGSVGPVMQAKIDEWRATLGPDDFAVMDAAAMMEAGYANWCDQLWLVTVDQAIARSRLMETRGMTEAEADQRLASQREVLEKREGADRWFANDGDLPALEAAVDAELTRIRDLHRRGELQPSVYGPWSPPYIERYLRARDRRMGRIQ